MKRSVILVLLTAMLLSACGETASENNNVTENASAISTDTVVETVAETEMTPALPADLTFADQEFKLLSGYYRDECNVTVEELNGEVLNDAIYTMETNTEERLKITFTEDKLDYNQAITLANNLIMSGDTSYSAMNHLDRFSIDMMVQGNLLPLDDNQYLDLTAPWWHPNVTSEMSVGGKTYYVASSSNILMYVDTTGIYINTDFAKDVGVSVDEIYTAVREGDWTMDQLMTYAATAPGDVDGDGKMTISDRWGMTTFDQNILGTSIITAGGSKSVSKDENDMLTLVWSDEKYMNLLEYAYSVAHNETVFTEAQRHTADIFAEGRSLFMHGFFLAVNSLSEMENDYTIVPIPKYDATQENYICANYDVMTYIMPKFVSDADFFGAVLEWLSYEGKAHVQDAYIETTMKFKAARDETMGEMVQICLDSSMIDIGSMYCYNFCGYDTIYLSVMAKDSFNAASFMKAGDKQIGRRLKEISEAITEKPEGEANP